jgi:hypothetical protein
MISAALAEPRTWRNEEFTSAIELQRIGDAIANEGVDHETLLIGGDDLLLPHLERLVAFVQRDQGFDERRFHLQARIIGAGGVDDPNRLAKIDHHHLLPLIDDEERVGGKDDRDEGDSQPDDQGAVHCPPS